MMFSFQDKFSIEEFILPLVLQDKLPIVDDFLKTSPRHQRELITFLDSLLINSSIRDAISELNLYVELIFYF